MQQITLAQAQQALALHANNNIVTVAQLQQLLQNVSVTFAQVTYVTDVLLAAQHKAQNIQKVTSANVLLASNINAATQLYARAVRKNAARYTQNDTAAVQAFTAQQNYFVHTATHCIVQHAQHAHKLYLFVICNSGNSVYMQDNNIVTKEHVAQYCTPSAARTMLQNDNTVHNKTHNIVHSVHVRTIALSNIVQLRARKQLLTV
jgi:hypothetical protein